MNTNFECGYLELIIGPMFSGKTSRLVEIYKQCQFCNISVVVINYNIDNRYDDELLITHDKVKIPCVKTEKLTDVWANDVLFEDKFNIKTCEVILINEGQFFEDLLEVVIDMLQKGKKIYVCGLDGDFERKKFGSILDLIPICDKVHKLSSLCSICKDGTHGIFSLRLTQQKEQTVIGSDNYIPVCRKCYNTNSNYNKNYNNLPDIYI
jgi:thymidine kinase